MINTFIKALRTIPYSIHEHYGKCLIESEILKHLISQSDDPRYRFLVGIAFYDTDSIHLKSDINVYTNALSTLSSMDFSDDELLDAVDGITCLQNPIKR